MRDEQVVMSALDEATAEKRRGSRDPNLTKNGCCGRTTRTQWMERLSGPDFRMVTLFVLFSSGTVKKKMANVATSTFVDPPSSHHLGPTI